ncbi:MAG: isopeptide-forming domain-containing fimbrial protein [Candidatus Nanopelagicales bacterium]
MRSLTSRIITLLAALFMGLGLAAATASPASADASVTLDKSAPGSVLLGENIPYELTAKNISASPLYNVGFSDVLPLGMVYVAGSVSPAVGEPAISVRGDGRQVLVWSNATDLQSNAAFTISFEAKWPAGSVPTTIVPEDTNNANVATQTDPRYVPKFDANGDPITTAPAGTVNTAADSATTKRAPFVIEKSEPSPEGELLRGVHNNRTTYTLKVRNNKVVPTEGITVADYIPAGLEFLGCGDVDNTTPDTRVEYPGPPPAPRLGVPALSPSPCPTPDSVETVVDPTTITGIGDLPGVWTRVGWTVGDLTPGEDVEIKYIAGIPLQENTNTWNPGPAPDPASGEQGSNLDNNNGRSTREGLSEQGLTNHARAIGNFTGTPAGSYVDSTTETVQVEDIRMRKSVSPDNFVPGNIATFTLKIDASEYVSGSNISVTDALPDGYCPLGPINYSDGDSACDPVGGQTPSTPYDEVNWDAGTATYQILFNPVDVGADDTFTITFPARMLNEYRGTGLPTVGGDSFVNTVSLEGTTTPIPGTSESGTAIVRDASSARQGSALPSIAKQMQPRAIPQDCSVLGDYTDPPTIPAPDRTFRKGDRICFKLRVDFPNISTRKPVVGDFLPIGTEYISGSATPTTNNTAPIASSLLPTAGPLVWNLGTGTAPELYIDPDAIFEVYIAVRVLEPATGPEPELTGNLMKLATANTAGEAQSYRDQADYETAPPPDLSIKKGVRETTAPAGTWNPPQDNKPVQQGSTATFQVDIKNTSQSAGIDAVVRGVQTWDVLPPGIPCANISNYEYIKPGTTTRVPLASYVTCIDPPVNGQSTSSYIKWEFPSPDAANDYSIPPGDTLSVLYDMKLPDQIGVNQQFVNTGYVRSFEVLSNENEIIAYYPKNNIDETVTPEQEDAPELKDPSNVFTRNASAGKSADTSVNEDNNNLTGQATIGETITYTYTGTVPAGTTAYDAELYDTLPSGIELVSIVDWGRDGLVDKPTGFTFDTNVGTNPTGKLVFPAEYQNTTAADQVFSVKVTAKVLPTAAPCATDPCLVPPAPATTVNKTNTATFRTKGTPTGSYITRTQTKRIDIVQPNPSVTKSADPTQMADQQTEITYTVALGNPSDRPPMHDSVLVDCLPSPFVVTSIVSPATGVTFGDGVGGCSGDGVQWDVGTLAAGGSPELVYKAKADGPLSAGGLYFNTAVLNGTSLNGTITGERAYKTDDTATVTAPTLFIGKTSTPEAVTIGETYTSVITATLNANVDYYSAAIVDTLPTGVSASSVNTVSVTCTYVVGGADCDPALPATDLTPDGQKIGWSFGDIADDPKDRKVTITYTARVSDVIGNTSGGSLTNSAQPHWSDVPVTTPPTTIAGFQALPKSLTPVSDTVKIVEPQLSIEKKVDTQDEITAAPGDVFTYTVKVSNWDDTYASTAYDIKVIDTIPAGVVVVGDPSDGGVLSGNTITWTLSSLAKGADKTFTYDGRLAPPGTTSQTNTVAIDEYFSLSADPDNPEIREYNGPSADAKVNPVLPALTIEKTATDGPLAYIDEPYTWTMEVSNDSQATAFAFGVKDTMPTNWEYVADSAVVTVAGGTPTQINPTVSGLDLTWADLGDLKSGEKASVQYQAKPTSAVTTDPGVGLGIDHVNTATTDWTDGPPTQGWATHESEPATAKTQIASADLMLEKTHETDYPVEWNVEPDEVVPGTEFDWKIKVTNNGEDNSIGPFVVEDTLPVGTEYKSYSGTDWTCNAVGQDVTCTNPGPVDGLVKDDSLPILTLTVKVDPAATAVLENVATVTGKTYDPKPENNTDDDPVTPMPLADLAIEKSRTQPYVVGNQVTYTLAVTNLGPSVSVADITVDDQLPTGLSIASIDAGPWVCQPTSGETATLKCVLGKDLDPNEQAPLINVTVDVLESPGDEAVNTAEVTGTTPDPNPDNNTSTVKDPVVSEVQLGIAKRTTGANPVTAGQSTEFTITVSNFGPAKAKNVVVVDELQAGLKATSATGPGWTCDVGSGTRVTCTRANFPLSASPSDIIVKADVDKSVPGGTTLKNVATVTTTSPQPGGNPPPATSTVDVVAKSDLAIFKTHNGGPWTIGKKGTWNVRVVNNGPSDNPGPITVVDNLPRGNEFLSAAGDGWTCTASGRTVTCVYGAGLVVGQEAGFSIRVNVVNGAAPEVVNPAEVTSPIEDTDPSNNKATDRVRVLRQKQTASKLPPNPNVLPASKTEQGQKIRTKVRCRTLKSSAAGEVSFCKITRKKNGTVKVKVVGNRKVKVTVIQRARGTKNYKPFKRVKTYIVRP